MNNKYISLLLLLLLLYCTNINGRSNPDVKHYVVYMGGHSYSDSKSVESANHELLASVLGSLSLAKKATVYHYTKSFRGFSALLSHEQANQLLKESSVVSVIEDKLFQLATTRSWDFMESPMFTQGNNDLGSSHGHGHRHRHGHGHHRHRLSPQHPHVSNGTTFASKNLSRSTQSWYNDQYGQHILIPTSSDLVIGIVDGGIWPEAASFNDVGLGPIPARFTSQCLPSNYGSECNRKIIGSRYYKKGYEAQIGPLEADGRDYYLSGRDDQGHGTHVASIVAGATIRYTLEGLGDHTMRGGAPGAKISVYKACWWNRCTCSDVMAAYDDAISDNVDIISMSLGPDEPTPRFFDDCFAMATLEAFKRGIFVSTVAGNQGFTRGVMHGWPWVTTVSASTIDRAFITPVLLGNSDVLQGYGVNSHEMQNYYQIISGEQAAADASLVEQARHCRPGSLYSGWIYEKIVICEWDDTGSEENTNSVESIMQQGGAGVIFIANKDEVDNIPYLFPLISSLLNPTETNKLQYYLNYDRNPVARIMSSQQVINVLPEPRMAAFSNMGPNPSTPALLKPDITAPGVNIVGAYYGKRDADPRSPLRAVMSGTSMACPHVSGVAAMIKDLHNDWSPAVIRSAIMTSAYGFNNVGNAITSPQGNVATPFNFGSGHLNPTKALDPGLVYDLGNADIAQYMCYFANQDWVRRELDMMIECNRAQPLYNLNYPSISVVSKAWPVTVTRTLTYVGGRGQPKMFTAEIEAPGGVIRTFLKPGVIDFTNQRQVSYTLMFMPGQVLMNEFYFGSITWRNSVYEVKSPISIYVEG